VNTIAQIDHGHDVEQIGWAVLKDVLGIFLNTGVHIINTYETNFQASMFQDTTTCFFPTSHLLELRKINVQAFCSSVYKILVSKLVVSSE
jgi:hypothetical protein